MLGREPALPSTTLYVSLAAIKLFAAGFAQIFLDPIVVMQGNFAVFHDLVTLTSWAIHRLESNLCNQFLAIIL
ncbi:hypothetical protein DO97_11265 [Neosynechococcus sphagnicola sy1]|uniref:Uncharacterized protein n=1 Tax=Neosynechococcus sphagnicola sy1 TaxID=1497020 RepID=A0A098TMZ3_9CYAN|nr:hypothetical protein DO97_11265 [Neosynechococcus sphagnicola sy1]